MSTFKDYIKDDFLFIRTKVGFSTPTFGTIDRTLDKFFEETGNTLTKIDKNELQTDENTKNLLRYFMACKGSNEQELKLFQDYVVRFDPRNAPEPIYSIVMKSRL
ncbi:MAG TPA: hypothetical protein VEC16_02925 [Alphaproteobacteria bacterium]|nr:hypothetical protein [Alphaproteobacteria bacterium]